MFHPGRSLLRWDKLLTLVMVKTIARFATKGVGTRGGDYRVLKPDVDRCLVDVHASPRRYVHAYEDEAAGLRAHYACW